MRITRDSGPGSARQRAWLRAVPPLALAAAILLALALPVGQAEAGRRPKARKGGNDQMTRVPIPRHAPAPPLSFLAGELHYDGSGGWEVNGQPVAFTVLSEIDGARSPQPVQPQDGDQVILMGSWVGGTLMVRRGVVEEFTGPRGGASFGLERPIRSVDPRSEAARDIPQ